MIFRAWNDAAAKSPWRLRVAAQGCEPPELSAEGGDAHCSSAQNTVGGAGESWMLEVTLWLCQNSYW
jgi:hypothetical protein